MARPETKYADNTWSFYFTSNRRLASYYTGAKNYDDASAFLKEVHSSLSPETHHVFRLVTRNGGYSASFGRQEGAEIFEERVSQAWITLDDSLSRRSHIRSWKDMAAKGKSISAGLYASESSTIHRLFHYSPKTSQSNEGMG